MPGTRKAGHDGGVWRGSEAPVGGIDRKLKRSLDYALVRYHWQAVAAERKPSAVRGLKRPLVVREFRLDGRELPL